MGSDTPSTAAEGRGGKLTGYQLGALHEVAAVEGKNWLYWHRRTSMKALENLGYVEMWRPKSLEHSKRTQLPYRITPAGREALSREKAE